MQSEGQSFSKDSQSHSHTWIECQPCKLPFPILCPRLLLKSPVKKFSWFALLPFQLNFNASIVSKSTNLNNCVNEITLRTFSFWKSCFHKSFCWLKFYNAVNNIWGFTIIHISNDFISKLSGSRMPKALIFTLCEYFKYWNEIKKIFCSLQFPQTKKHFNLNGCQTQPNWTEKKKCA